MLKMSLVHFFYDKFFKYHAQIIYNGFKIDRSSGCEYSTALNNPIPIFIVILKGCSRTQIDDANR